MKYKFNLGFTLMEIIVVVAMVGILATIVLASLNNARSSGANSAVKADLKSLPALTELYYSANGSYGVFAQATCSTAVAGLFFDPKTAAAIAHAVGQGGNRSSCVSDSETWAVAVGLKTAAQSWCVDSTGVVKLELVATPNLAITAGRCT